MLGLAGGHTVRAQQTVSGDLVDYVTGLLNELPGSSGNDYLDPDDEEATSWQALIEDLLLGDLTTADALATAAAYEVVRFTDTSDDEDRLFYILQRAAGGENYWGVYVFNPSSCQQLLLEAPHPMADLHTEDEALYVFNQMDATALFVAGTHRCNVMATSSCSGTTTVCTGSSEAFRLSDVAHNSASAFHLATRALVEEYPKAIVIQLHGFSKGTGDPSLIMSNGTRITPATDYVSMIYDALVAQDASLTAKIAHEDLSWSELIALTNVQGRMVNASFDPCAQSATSTQGRFIHIEQEYDALRKNDTGWAIMATALEAVFRCDDETVTAVDPETAQEQVTVYPNPVTHLLTVGGVTGKAILLVYNLNGELVLRQEIDGETTLDVSKWPTGLYAYTLIEDGHAVHGTILKTKS